MEPSAALRVLCYKPRPERQTIRMEGVMTCEPLELEYLYTVLDREAVTLLDGMTDHQDPVRLARRIRADVVLVTAFVTNVEGVHRLASRLSRLDPAPRLFVGGPHAEVVPEHFFHPGVSGVFFANQLAALREVMDRIHEGRPYDDVAGAAFPKGDEWTRNPGPPLDPASLPIPKRVLFEAHPERYKYLYFDRCASVKTAFGCHEKCTFCFCTEMHGGRFGPRPIPAVMDEIAAIPATNVFVLDDNFLSSRARVEEFCRAIRERGIRKRFVIYGGADFVSRNPDLMRELRDAGVAGIIVGFEFTDDNALAAVHKKARLADNDRTLAVCRDLGIELFALFMVDPDWTVEDFQKLAAYVRSREIAFATFATLTILPGTRMAADAPPAGGQGPWWRYDLLRLHRKPRHLSPMRYYLWLFYLYMLPGLNAGTGKRLRRLFGTWGFVKLLAKSAFIGIEYLMKLLIWR